MGKTIVIAQNIGETLTKEVEQEVPGWKVITGKEKEDWEPYINEADIVAGWKPEMFEQLADNAPLKWIQTWSAGVDNLPLTSYEQAGFLLTSANGVHAYPISETIFAFLLGWTRKMHAYIRQQQKKEWHHAHLKGEIHEKTILIYGVGAIGKETAKIAKAFGMHVIGVRRTKKETPEADETLTFEEASSRLAECDYVVNTLPSTEETKQLFTKDLFEKMKEETFFVNIGRGDTVDEEALLSALQKGDIAGAGLDVFSEEPLPEDHPFWTMDNVIMTPHTAGSTGIYHERVIRDIFIPNLRSYVNGRELPVNRVDYKAGY
ncbi:D-2-hydroxyacid dehydrogenase [Alkalicoccus halolimnae]|uniref:D-2-hydroxyacid dehydrogenase n=1 Tax=Alkalicoccus halolimnae TaxID=1667239 RepID=A0A5C7FID9_9BACI|nr:D-2-hydroxyacid dehydrogenase [Alkalicoccus halolimnae]TXF83932.1 D-2-hydroxyacid dehydrogenase [Alkalicoccus halolimnae]